MQKELINQLKAEDENAFKTLVESYKDKVLNICYHYLHNRLDAEDLAQEVFIEVHRSIGHFKEESQLSTWIYRIAVNKSLDLIRKKKRKKRFAHVLSYFGATDDEKELQLPAPGNPETNFEQKERIQILNAAMDRLPESQKTAITLSKYEGLSNKEIAVIMNISTSAVEALSYRAKKNLYKQLHNYFEDFY